MKIVWAAFLVAQAGSEGDGILRPDEKPREMLRASLLEECARHFDARRQAVAALKTPEDVRRRQEDLKARFLRALGGFPERTPLNARVVGELRRDGYRVEKVIYESRPGHAVTAVLYLPEGSGPFPGVLVPCGHSENGKAAETYQRVCILLARHGFVALCYDPIGQGERKQILPAAGKPFSSTIEHTHVGVGALLVGWSAATYRIWDGIRSLDYLASRPEVDPARLGCTGNSGGGTLTAYLMALDDRIRAAAPSCYITSLERLFATIGPQDAEQNITGQVAFGMEHADYVTLRAPRPTIMLIGTRDYFDAGGAWTTFREAKRAYGILGHGERVDLFEYDDQHGFSKPRREAALRWMRRWLQGIDDAPFEPDFPVAKDEELQCTPTGQVLRDLGGRSAFDFTAERARELAARRPRLEGDRLREEVARRIGLGDPPRAAAWEPRGEGRGVWKTDPGILVPAVVSAGGSPEGPVILFLHGEGKEKAAVEPEAAAGARRVVAADLRGLGETAPPSRAGEWERYFGPEWRESFLAIHLDRSLLGLRVRDILSIVRALEGERVHVVATGAAVPVALHAAALEPRIECLTLEKGVLSWSAIAQTPVSVRQLPHAVPGALEAYDLADLAAALAPRPLTLRSPRDPQGNPLAPREVEEAWAVVREAYARAGAAERLVLDAGR
jgi:dienelactone hydrolase/pimeloyl-ACP methyl ester carboxylesterase